MHKCLEERGSFLTAKTATLTGELSCIELGKVSMYPSVLHTVTQVQLLQAFTAWHCSTVVVSGEGE